jgi:hypothetical protein
VVNNYAQRQDWLLAHRSPLHVLTRVPRVLAAYPISNPSME